MRVALISSIAIFEVLARTMMTRGRTRRVRTPSRYPDPPPLPPRRRRDRKHVASAREQRAVAGGEPPLALTAFAKHLERSRLACRRTQQQAATGAEWRTV